jgi:hypothetical protein
VISILRVFEACTGGMNSHGDVAGRAASAGGKYTRTSPAAQNSRGLAANRLRASRPPLLRVFVVISILRVWGIHLTGVERKLGQWNVPMPAPISAPKGCSRQAAETTRTSAQLGATFAEPPLEANP